MDPRFLGMGHYDKVRYVTPLPRGGIAMLFRRNQR